MQSNHTDLVKGSFHEGRLFNTPIEKAILRHT
ncbi:MAG: hypothetical protein ACI9T7_002947 [Oleiphilaceae bacterium]|jgi:hypothetical protein